MGTEEFDFFIVATDLGPLVKEKVTFVLNNIIAGCAQAASLAKTCLHIPMLGMQAWLVTTSREFVDDMIGIMTRSEEVVPIGGERGGTRRGPPCKEA